MKGYLSERIFIGVLISIISIFLALDLFLRNGMPVTFDGPTHISNIAQIYAALRDGEFPARWGGGFARYGLPIPIIAQQVTSYLGAVLTFVTGNVLISYYLVMWLGGLLSTSALYLLLRKHSGVYASLAGSFLFHFAPYRIMNVYIRGALPEFFSTFFTILIMIGMHTICIERKPSGYILITIALTLLLLTHPFMVVVSAFVLVPYGWYLLKTSHSSLRSFLLPLLCWGGLAIGIAAYYIFPLFIEIRYFYYGLATSHFVEGHFLTLSQFFFEQWYYFYRGDIFPRGHVHTGGWIEGVIVFSAIAFLIFKRFQKKPVPRIIIYFVGAAIMTVLFTQPITAYIYRHTPFGNIQHPWRMLSAYILIPPILLATLMERVSRKAQFILLMGIICCTALTRFPELYGKNYTHTPLSRFFLTEYNLHGQVMDTVWMGDETTYPFKSSKPGIIEGKGMIRIIHVKNASRTYEVDAVSTVRMIDYTFYYPGWSVYIDSVPTTIQFQDPNYRGIITYMVPSGRHTVRLVFEETKIRLIADVITIMSIIVFILLVSIKNTRYMKTFLFTPSHE